MSKLKMSGLVSSSLVPVLSLSAVQSADVKSSNCYHLVDASHHTVHSAIVHSVESCMYVYLDTALYSTIRSRIH
jgi:hypothetical protein